MSMITGSDSSHLFNEIAAWLSGRSWQLDICLFYWLPLGSLYLATR
jgi:hypothetical protein